MSNNNISTRSDSAASTGHEVKFKCLLKINRKDTGGPVYFKWDGERFKTTSETLKLQSGTDYTITLELQPPLELLLCKIAGIEYTFELVNDPEKDSKSIYKLTWATHGIDPTDNRHRADVPFSIKFKNYRALDFNLQVKFYSKSESSHISWGQLLNHATINCTAGKGSFQSYVDDMKYH